MGKINTNNYPNRPVSDYQDDDMFILQDNGGETYTTNIGDIKELIGEETAPELALKVDKNGTDRLMTAAEGTKLAGIAAGAQVNVLEGVQVNGSDLPITNKKVNVDISGKTDLSVIAYTFNSEMGYFKGAYVTYNGKLYEFIQEHTGAWNPSHVREIRASGQYVRTGNGGYNNGDRATCEGYMTKASGNYSHAEGRETQAVGDCTHAEGRETIANGIYQHVEGKYNVVDDANKYIHIIGNGIDADNRRNAFTIDWEGNIEASGGVSARGVTTEDDIECGGVLKADGADYAENFMPSEECPFGRFVTLDGEKIRLAQPHDGYVLGVTSPHPAIMGDQECEGIPVGLLGKLWVEHDGTLNVNGYAIAGDNGIATAYIGVQLLDRPTPTIYRVMAIDGNMAKILFR